MKDVMQHIANGGGICGTCLNPAEATYENEGYSYCCNDRIEYGDEATTDIRERAYQSCQGEEIELLGSWGQAEGEGKLLGTYTDKYGNDLILYMDERGFEAAKSVESEGANYGWRKV